MLLALWLLLPALGAQAQTPRPLPPVPDSLRGPMARATTPTLRLAALERVAKAYAARIDSTGTLAYARALEALARQQRNPRYEGDALHLQAEAYLVLKMLPQALRLSLQALPLRTGIQLAETQQQLGQIYDRLHQNSQVLPLLRAAQRTYRAAHMLRESLNIDSDLGQFFQRNDQLDSAEYYFLRFARGFQAAPALRRYAGTSYVNLAALSYERKQYAAQYRYARQALALERAARDSTHLGGVFGVLCVAALNLDSLPQAIAFGREALRLSRQFRRLDIEQSALNNLGSGFLKLKQPDSAAVYFRQALASTRQGGLPTKRGQFLQWLAETADAAQQPAEALRLALEVAALDSLHRTTTIAIANLGLLARLAHARHDDGAALDYYKRQRTLERRQAATNNSQQIATLRVRFDTERTEQQLALATARVATEAQRALALRLLATQREATYRDTLSQRDRQRLLQQLLAQQQAAQVERAGQQVTSLTQRTRAQAQQARLQRALAAQQQQRLWALVAVLAALLAGLAVATVLALRLRRSRNELAASRATQDRLYALVAHDLRSPVTAFEGLSDLIDHYVQRQDTAALAGVGGLIQQTAHSLRGLLENLLHWALHQRGELVAHPQPVPVRDILAETVALYQATALAADITLTLGAAPDLRLWADAQMSRTIVRNLVGNALKATPTGGRVTLTATAQNGTATIEVQDTGPGFGEAQLGRPAARRPQSAADRAGLGLLLSQAFASAQDGALALRNAPGGGALAVLTLPVAVP